MCSGMARRVEVGLHAARFRSIQDTRNMVKRTTQISRSGGLCFGSCADWAKDADKSACLWYIGR